MGYSPQPRQLMGYPPPPHLGDEVPPHPDLAGVPPTPRPGMRYPLPQTCNGVPPPQTVDGVPPTPDLQWATPPPPPPQVWTDTQTRVKTSYAGGNNCLIVSCDKSSLKGLSAGNFLPLVQVNKRDYEEVNGTKPREHLQGLRIWQ